jgi:hypothetical protein
MQAKLGLVMGYSRDRFYPFKEAVKAASWRLQEISRRKPVLKNRTAPELKAAMVEMAIEQPAYGKVRMANEEGLRGA